MMRINPEQEINRIRLELYEETKNLSKEERTEISNARGKQLADKYGFTICKPINGRKISNRQ